MNYNDSFRWLDISSFSFFSISILQIIDMFCEIRKLKIKRPQSQITIGGPNVKNAFKINWFKRNTFNFAM
jgi:hypothetical protein